MDEIAVEKNVRAKRGVTDRRGQSHTDMDRGSGAGMPPFRGNGRLDRRLHRKAEAMTTSIGRNRRHIPAFRAIVARRPICALSMFLALVALVAFGSASRSFAAQYIVPKDYPTLTAALGVAASGDKITLLAGTYCLATGEAFPLVIPSDITIKGAGMHSTVIDATGSGESVFWIEGMALTASVAISDMEIRGGGGPSAVGGAFYLGDLTGSIPYLHNLLIRNNAAFAGGAIYASQASLLIENCEIRDNAARFLGGGVVGADAGCIIRIQSSVVAGNSVEFGYGGGCLAGTDALLWLIGTEVSENQAEYGAGALVQGTLKTTADSSGVRTVIRANAARFTGGGMLVLGGGAAELSQTEFLNNTAPTAAAWGASGGSVKMDRGRLYYNAAATGHLIEATNAALALTNLEIARNSAPGGNIVRLQNTSGDLIHNTIAFNTSKSSTLDGAIVIQGVPSAPGAILRIDNNIVAYNSGVGIVERNASSDPELLNNLLYSNSLAQYTDEGVFVYVVDFQIGYFINNSPRRASGNITVSPSFRRPQLNDFRLLGSSGALDKGEIKTVTADEVNFDFDGLSRRGAVAGAAPDIGAHEIHRPQLAGPVLLHSPNEGGPSAGDELILRFNRPVLIPLLLDRYDFYLPVSGDTLGGAVTATVDSANPNWIRVKLTGSPFFTVPYTFYPTQTGPGDPSGIALLAAGAGNVIDAETGLGAVPLGNDMFSNSTAMDIVRTAAPWTARVLPASTGGTLATSAASYLPATQLTLYNDSLFYDCGLRLRSPSVSRSTASAVQFEIYSGSPLLRSNKYAYLRMQYDPLDYTLQGWREEDLQIHRLTETGTDQYEFLPLGQLEGTSQTQSLASHTLSVALKEIIPARPVRRLKAEPGPGSYLAAVYAVLPVGPRPGTQTIRTASPGAPGAPAAIRITGSDELALAGAEFPGYRQGTGTTAISATVRRPEHNYESPIGRTRRLPRLTTSNALAFEARNAASGSLRNSFTAPSNVTLRYANGQTPGFESDLLGWDGSPCCVGQLRMYRYSPSALDWVEVSAGATALDAAKRTLTAQGAAPLVEDGGVGLYAVAGDPDAEFSQSFNAGTQGWSYAALGTGLPQATPSATGGLLKLTATGAQSYGSWKAPAASFVQRRDVLYLATFRVATDQEDAAVPGFRLRITSGDGQAHTTLQITGGGTHYAVPSASGGPADYYVLYPPTRHGLDSALAGDTAEGSFIPAFDMAHVLAAESPRGMVGLQSLNMQIIDLDSLGPWEQHADYNFVGASDMLGWEYYGPAVGTGYFTYGASAEGMYLKGAVAPSVASLAINTGLDVLPAMLYRVKFRVKADSDNALIPVFQLRAGDQNIESLVARQVVSDGGGEESPAYGARDYDLYYYPPQKMAGRDAGQLMLFFDYGNLSSSDRVTTRFTIERVTVHVTPWEP